MDLIAWSGFVALVLALLALDLGVFNRKVHEPTVAEALGWSAFWIALAMAFNGLVYFLYENNWIGVGLAFPVDIGGRQAALEFFTGYVLEKSLSLDNIFVIALIFSYFRVPLRYQHRVLFWGVLGALVMRGVMIGAGAALMSGFSWMTYVFGGLLLLTAVRMLTATHENLDPERSILVRLARRLYPVTDGLREQRFFVMERGVRSMTPLFLVLLMVEGTDVLFAVDSIPAIFAVTDDPFLVYTSNVFAILGLRSLYFVLAPLLGRIRFLKVSLVFVLAFVGVKMIVAHHHPIPVLVSLSVIVGILGLGLLASLLMPVAEEGALRSPVEAELDRLFRLTRSVAIRSSVLMLGGTLIAIGVFLLVIPGLGIKAILGGLTLLAPQFVWARTLLNRARDRMGGRAPPRRNARDPPRLKGRAPHRPDAGSDLHEPHPRRGPPARPRARARTRSRPRRRWGSAGHVPGLGTRADRGPRRRHQRLEQHRPRGAAPDSRHPVGTRGAGPERGRHVLVGTEGVPARDTGRARQRRPPRRALRRRGPDLAQHDLRRPRSRDEALARRGGGAADGTNQLDPAQRAGPDPLGVRRRARSTRGS